MLDLLFLFRNAVAGIAIYAILPLLDQIGELDPMSGAAAALGVGLGAWKYVHGGHREQKA